LTGTDDGLETVLGSSSMVKSIFTLAQDVHVQIARDAILSLINLTAKPEHAIKISGEAMSSPVNSTTIRM